MAVADTHGIRPGGNHLRVAGWNRCRRHPMDLRRRPRRASGYYGCGTCSGNRAGNASRVPGISVGRSHRVRSVFCSSLRQRCDRRVCRRKRRRWMGRCLDVGHLSHRRTARLNPYQAARRGLSARTHARSASAMRAMKPASVRLSAVTAPAAAQVIEISASENVAMRDDV